MNAATSPRLALLYQTNPLTSPVRISGTPRVSLNAAFSKAEGEPDRRPGQLPGTTGNGTILTRGWMDPENRDVGLHVTEPITPGTFYKLDFDMQAKDAVDPGRAPARR